MPAPEVLSLLGFGVRERPAARDGGGRVVEIDQVVAGSLAFQAGLRPGMLRMAGREAEGAIINWLSADDVKQVAAEVGPEKEIVARIFVCPSEDAERVAPRRFSAVTIGSSSCNTV